MRITLEEKQINDAIIEYLKQQGLSLQGKHVETTFTVGRGANPTTVEIALSDASVQAQAVQTNTRKLIEGAPGTPVEVSQVEAETENKLTQEMSPETTGKSLFSN